MQLSATRLHAHIDLKKTHGRHLIIVIIIMECLAESQTTKHCILGCVHAVWDNQSRNNLHASDMSPRWRSYHKAAIWFDAPAAIIETSD